jgi:curved DNA-binding protein CbpA
MTIEKRRKQRHVFDCALEISWRDSDGIGHTAPGRAADLSDTGIRVEVGEPIQAGTDLHLRAERYGLTGSATVRHSTRRGSKYVLGLEFKTDAAAGEMDEAEPFVDYYELLQISHNAEAETIHRVFRIMASRYHPDNKETGDNERFLLLSKGYAILSDPARRASYDDRHRRRHAQPLPVFGLKEFAEGLDGEVNRRLGILSLLYNRRRTNPDNPGLSLLEFESVMAFPREHLEFAIWFLLEKQYVRPGNTSDYSISSAGVEYLESEAPSHGVLSKLLHAPQANAEAEPQQASAEELDSQSLALVRARR